MNRIILCIFGLPIFLIGSLAKGADPVPVTPENPVNTVPSADRFDLGIRGDCTHDFSKDQGETQNCLSLTSARLRVFHQASTEVSAQVEVDPYSTPKSSYRNAPSSELRPEPLNGDFISGYRLVWLPRPHLEVSIESYDGTTRLPSVSGLALANLHNDTGWRQSAATLTYNLSLLSDMQVKFVVGNGEGEYRANVDPQQYFGFRTSAEIVKGVRLILGVSVDGNDVGSDEYSYQMSQFEANCGIDTNQFSDRRGASTQRIAAAIELDGSLERAKDLLLSVGYQRSVVSDLNKKSLSRPTKNELNTCRKYEATSLFVEDESADAVNTVQRILFNLNGRYRLTNSIFAAIDYSLLKLDTGSVEVFSACNSYENGVCVSTGKSFNNLSINSYTFGAGLNLAPGLEFTVEMYKSSYDKKYAKSFYDAPDGKVADTQEYFNARVSYNWL
jgi:hypothetical protein